MMFFPSLYVLHLVRASTRNTLTPPDTVTTPRIAFPLAWTDMDTRSTPYDGGNGVGVLGISGDTAPARLSLLFQTRATVCGACDAQRLLLRLTAHHAAHHGHPTHHAVHVFHHRPAGLFPHRPRLVRAGTRRCQSVHVIHQ